MKSRFLEEESLSIALSKDSGRERKRGGCEQAKRSSNSTPVTDQDFPLCFVTLPTLAVAAINARGMPDSGERSSAEFFAPRPPSGTIRGHGVSPTWDITIPDTASGKSGPFALRSSVSREVRIYVLPGSWARAPVLLPSDLCDWALTYVIGGGWARCSGSDLKRRILVQGPI